MIVLKAKVMDENLKMLLVDDDESVVRWLTVVIGRAFQGRIDLTALTDPLAAKSWIDRNSPELVVTDLEMPLVDGFEILRCVKQRNPFSQVILHSGHFSAEALRLALKLEAADYVQKCADSKELCDALEHAHRRVIRWTQALAGVARNAKPSRARTLPLFRPGR